MNEPRKNVVTVTIAGEEYALRATATPEHTLRCAELVDTAVREILAQTALVQPQKAAILAALSLADQLVRARAQLEDSAAASEGFARRLALDLEQRLAAG